MDNAGRMVHAAWDDLTQHYPNLELDQFITMPNHTHGIIVIVGAGSPRPTVKGSPRLTIDGSSRPTVEVLPRPYATQQVPLGQMIAYFKYQSTKRINAMRGTPVAKLWQRNYYEHIIRNDHELIRIREYIANNPAKWDLDRENPQSGASLKPAPATPEWET